MLNLKSPEILDAAIFNKAQEHFINHFQPTDKSIDITLTVRIRAYGNNDEKQNDWNNDWRSKHPDWKPVQSVTVSSNPPEIWLDLLQDAQGNLVLPHHALGHEVNEALKLIDSRIIDPDLLTKEITYK